MTRFILDSGDPEEYKAIATLAKEHNEELWGGTTNPSLIAKKLTGDKKYTQKEAQELQKDIIFQLLKIVPGAVSAEVFANTTTTGEEMAEEGSEIATWHERVVIKIPTTLEGFKARTLLRKKHIPVNNTLVFSQEQIYAICLHEALCQKAFGDTSGHIENVYPPFISPFVGRLDDIGENGMMLVENGMRLKQSIPSELWMLEASVRSLWHMKKGIDLQTELITAPAKIYEQWFQLTDAEKGAISEDTSKILSPTPAWNPSDQITKIASLEQFTELLTSNTLPIQHPLTDQGLIKFAEDWKTILSS